MRIKEIELRNHEFFAVTHYDGKIYFQDSHGFLLTHEQVNGIKKDIIEYKKTISSKEIESENKEQEKKLNQSYLDSSGPIKKIKEKIPGFVYVGFSRGLYKIGRARNVESRISGHKTSNPGFELIYSFPCKDHLVAEKELHKMFDEKRETGEWFSLNRNDLETIKQFHFSLKKKEVSQ